NSRPAEDARYPTRRTFLASTWAPTPPWPTTSTIPAPASGHDFASRWSSAHGRAAGAWTTTARARAARGQELDAPDDGRAGPLWGLDDRALVLRGQERSRSSRHAASQGPRRRWRAPERERQAARGRAGPTHRAPDVDDQAAPRQPRGARACGRVAGRGAVVRDPQPLHEALRPGPPAAAEEPGDAGRREGCATARGSRGPQLRGQPCGRSFARRLSRVL